MACDKVVVWQRCVCVWKMVCGRDGVWKIMCVKDGVWERWCVRKLCVCVWQSCVWKMACDKAVVWQSCVCVWKMVCDKDGFWKMCVKDVCERCVWKMVCVCVTKMVCDKDGVWKMVRDKDGVWQSCVCVTKLCVWQSCVLQVVCVCVPERWCVTNTDGVWQRGGSGGGGGGKHRSKNNPSGGGGKPRQRFECFWKECRFRHSETIDLHHKNAWIFPRENQVFFTCCPVIYREFCLQKVRDLFLSFSSPFFCNMRPVFSKRFSLELSQRHFQTLMLHISFGLTWLLTLVTRLHGMADFDSLHIASTPPVWIRTYQNHLFSNSLLGPKDSLWVVASFLPTHPQTQDVMSHARVSQVDVNVNIRPTPPTSTPTR